MERKLECVERKLEWVEKIRIGWKANENVWEGNVEVSLCHIGKKENRNYFCDKALQTC